MAFRGDRACALATGMFVSLAPAFVLAASPAQLVPLYAQLENALERELLLLAPNPALSIEPVSGHAPLSAIFTLSSLTKTEAIDFGDGHSTGSGGCARNALGFCDLRSQLVHTYLFPDTYLITLYRHVGLRSMPVGTTTVTVLPALTAASSSPTVR